MQLNDQQKKVLEFERGELLVVAGAGTGKTRVLVEHINKLLNDGVKESQILAVTFTEKAASEMLERVLQARSGVALELPILTFNAFGHKLLEEFNVEAGLNRNFKLLSDNAQLVFLREHIEELNLKLFSPLSNPYGLLEELSDYFSLLKQHVITPEAFQKFVGDMRADDEAEKLEKVKHQEIAQAYQTYLKLCQQHNVIDYDDQIFRALMLLKNFPNVKKKLQQRFHTVMIDEFQDTNPMQSKLIDLLHHPEKSLIVVGDDDQSIYGFRGATLANILDFQKRYPKTKEVALTKNYRSTQAILDASYDLIQNNNPERLEARLDINKKLTSEENGDKPLAHKFSQIDFELDWLANDIKAKLEGDVKPGEIAVLARSHRTAQRVSSALNLAEVEHVVIGQTTDLYHTEVVRMCVEALKCVADPENSLALHHTLTSPLFNIAHQDLSQISLSAKRQHQSLGEALADNENDDIKKALGLIRTWQNEAASLSVGKLLYKIIDTSGYKEKLWQQAQEDPGAELTAQNLARYFKTLKEFESIAVQPTVLSYLESYQTLEAAGEASEDDTLKLSNDMVNILTIHKAKGLEWDHVYIPDLTEISFPMRARSKTKLPEELTAETSSAADDHYAEERRLMYVAATRARKNLNLSFSEKHYTETTRKPSRFIEELGVEVYEHQAEGEAQLKLLEIPETTNQVTALPESIFSNGVIKLSTSQIVKYLNCPLDFYYNFVLGMPEEKNSQAAYGTAVHGAIEKINQGLLDEKPPVLKDLQTEIEENWQAAGFISKAHSEESKKQALKTVEDFYHKQLADKNNFPSRVEWPFRHELKDIDLEIRGRLDAVFEGSDKLEIRDYKTSSTVNTPEKAKSRLGSSKQLTIYALIWQDLFGELPKKVSLEFVDTKQLASKGIRQQSIDTMQKHLAEMVEAIKNHNFQPGNDHTYCAHPNI